MTNAYKQAPYAMLRARSNGLRVNVKLALDEAHIPQAEWGEDSEGMTVCMGSGYWFEEPGSSTGRVVDIAILGRTDVKDEIRGGERDALTQQARAALNAAGFDVRVNDYGHLKIVDTGKGREK